MISTYPAYMNPTIEHGTLREAITAKEHEKQRTTMCSGMAPLPTGGPIGRCCTEFGFSDPWVIRDRTKRGWCGEIHRMASSFSLYFHMVSIWGGFLSHRGTRKKSSSSRLAFFIFFTIHLGEPHSRNMLIFVFVDWDKSSVASDIWRAAMWGRSRVSSPTRNSICSYGIIWVGGRCPK